MPTKNFDRMNPGCVLALRGYEGTGSLIHDVSKYRNNGTGTAITWSQLASGLNTMVFDGATSVVDCGNDTSLRFTGAFSFVIWGKRGVIGTQHEFGGRYEFATADRVWSMNLNGVNKQIFAISNDGTVAISLVEDGTFTDVTNWYQFVGVYVPSTSMTMYRNAAVIPSTPSGAIPASLKSNAINLIIGARKPSAPQEFFNGSLALPRVFNTALSAEHIKHLFNQERFLFNV